MEWLAEIGHDDVRAVSSQRLCPAEPVVCDDRASRLDPARLHPGAPILERSAARRRHREN
jgi:hypothetical protein